MKICECGTWDDTELKYNVNMSGIYSHLIRECGRLVDNYNSDIIYDIEKMNTILKSFEDNETAKVWIGLRQCGVDDELFMKTRIDTTNYYREIYSVEIVKTGKRCDVILKDETEKSFKEYENTINV